jgi:hypothetical protein
MRYRQRLRGRRRFASSTGKLSCISTGASLAEKSALGDWSCSDGLRSWGGLRYGAGRFTGAGVDRATLVAVNGSSLWVLNRLDIGELSWLLVVFNALPDLQVQGATKSGVQVGKEFGLKDTGEKGVGFLGTNNQ